LSFGGVSANITPPSTETIATRARDDSAWEPRHGKLHAFSPGGGWGRTRPQIGSPGLKPGRAVAQRRRDRRAELRRLQPSHAHSTNQPLQCNEPASESEHGSAVALDPHLQIQLLSYSGRQGERISCGHDSTCGLTAIRIAQWMWPSFSPACRKPSRCRRKHKPPHARSLNKAYRRLEAGVRWIKSWW